MEVKHEIEDPESAKDPTSTAIYRRKIVEELMIKRYSLRGIADYLHLNGIINLTTGMPFSIQTISIDRKKIRRQWAESMKAPFEELKNECIMALRRVEMEAWEKGDLELVRRCIADHRSIFGFDAPKAVDVSLSPEMLNAILAVFPTEFSEDIRKALDEFVRIERRRKSN